MLAINLMFSSTAAIINMEHAEKAGGLSHQGDTIDPNDILLLEKGSHRKWQTVMAVVRPPSHVEFVNIGQ